MRGATFTLAHADLKNISRDPLLLLLAAIAPAFALTLRFLFPWAEHRTANTFNLGAYADLTSAFLLLIAPMLLGFIIGLMLLDERDDGILSVIAVTPTGTGRFLIYRIVAPVIWSVVGACLVVWFAGLSTIDLIRFVPLAVLAGLEAPLLALFLAANAGNKVEGMALSKVGNVVMGLALLFGVLPSPWCWLGAPIPAFWLVRAFLERTAPWLTYAAFIGLAFLTHAVALMLLLRQFNRRAA